MKNLILATLLATSFISKSFAETSNSTSTYSGKAQVGLQYYGVGLDYGYVRTFTSEGGIALTIMTLGAAPLIGLPFSIETAQQKSNSFKIKVKAVLNEVGNDRLSLRLSTTVKKGCGGFSIPLIAEGDGFGNYDIYKNNEDYVANKKIGRLMKADKNLFIDIDAYSDIKTSGTGGNQCVWDLSNGLQLELELEGK